ncbi:DUF2274 domain-containing protein [Allorhizobium taibaishanense]|uniref:Small protein n=1 Tax=Allorhizobium taibaishanense TaxID=887144 RepID=A0A1Q9A0D6_9HYPH|nr:DUF2274 domain-containing protein [Allorhizobium taibaishanense]MBB4010496.1 hypothetical protein [Allorhizobium taibaishanense]OLP47961.1 small protein [Allorhizobium taibaishanense]
MTKLKLSAIPDDRPVKITVELPAAVFQDLQAYAVILARANGEATPPEPVKLIAPMIQKFMASDRDFGKAKRNHPLPRKDSNSAI